MGLYILYPNAKTGKVKIVNHKPAKSQFGRTYGFAEGPLKDRKAVIARLNWMNIPNSSRPKNYYGVI